MGGGNGQRALGFTRKFTAGLAQIFCLQKQPVDDGQDALARIGQAGQALAVALEDFDAKLVFKLADLAAHPGLRGKQHVGHFSQVIAAPRSFADRTQLLEIHGCSSIPYYQFRYQDRMIALQCYKENEFFDMSLDEFRI